jgi:hypothetical protein
MRTEQRHTRRLWPWIIVIVGSVVALIAPITWLPGTSDARASRQAGDYRSVTTALERELPSARDALMAITDPLAGPENFGGVVVPLFRLEGRARLADEASAAGLPAAWPFAPSEPFDELRPAQEDLADSADSALSIVDDLVEVLNYRVAVVDILAVGDLPAAAPLNFRRFEARLDEQRELQAAALAALPRADLLRDHAEEVRTAVDRFGDWVDEYTQSLWTGDEIATTTLLVEHRILRDGLRAGLAIELARIRATIEAEIAELDDSLDGILAELDGIASGG